MNDPFLGLLLALPVIWLIGIVPPIIEEHVERKRVEKWRKENEAQSTQFVWRGGLMDDDLFSQHVYPPPRDEETKE